MRDLFDDVDLSGFLGRSAKIVLILVLAVVFARLGGRLAGRSIRSLGTRSPLRDAPRAEQRATTLAGVAVSVVRIFVWSVAVLLMLSEVGLNLGPLIAGASIVGVALGFGAQSLVKDFVSGFFILVEDQYGVGDTVDLGEATGTVEAVGLRVTTLRDVNGTVWYVRNGEVLRVGNSSQGYSVAVVDLPVGHDADIPETTELAGRTAIELTAEGSALADDVLEPPEVLGVESISPGGVTLRITTKVRAGRQWAVQRALLAGIKDAFADAGVPPPSPVGGFAAPPT